MGFRCIMAIYKISHEPDIWLEVKFKNYNRTFKRSHERYSLSTAFLIIQSPCQPALGIRSEAWNRATGTQPPHTLASQIPRDRNQGSQPKRCFLGDQPGTRWGRQGQPEQWDRLVFPLLAPRRLTPYLEDTHRPGHKCFSHTFAGGAKIKLQSPRGPAGVLWGSSLTRDACYLLPFKT